MPQAIQSPDDRVAPQQQPDHSASLGNSITSSTWMRFSIHTTIAISPTKQRSTSCNSITPISGSGLRMRPRCETLPSRLLEQGKGNGKSPLAGGIGIDQRFRAHDRACMIPAAPVPGIAAPLRQSARSEEIDRALQLRTAPIDYDTALA